MSGPRCKISKPLTVSRVHSKQYTVGTLVVNIKFKFPNDVPFSAVAQQ